MNDCVIKFILAHPVFSQNGALVEAKSGHTWQQLLITLAAESSVFAADKFELALGETVLAETDTMGSSARFGTLFYQVVNIYPTAQPILLQRRARRGFWETPALQLMLGLAVVMVLGLGVGMVVTVVVADMY